MKDFSEITFEESDPWIGYDESQSLTAKEIRDLYEHYVNKGLPIFLDILGFVGHIPVRSVGIELTMKNGRKFKDFTGGISVLNFGHNHPRVLKARKKLLHSGKPEFWSGLHNPLQVAAAHNLIVMSPEGFTNCLFANSGAEANELALKTAILHPRSKGKTILFADNSFHGKTQAMLSISGQEQQTLSYFNALEDRVSFKHGDIQDLKRVIENRKKKLGGDHDIAALILEAIVAEELYIPDDEYLPSVRKICEEEGILLIMDEVFTGMGKTGKFLAFEHWGIHPDMYTIAKSLGGGKGSISACVMTKDVYEFVYGTEDAAFNHSSSFNGISSECAAMIEALNILKDENLIENAASTGEYFLNRLEEVGQKYPGQVDKVTGKGMLLNLELHPPFRGLIKVLSKVHPFFIEIARKLVTGVTISELFRNHGILVLPVAVDKAGICINPSLICDRQDVDHFVSSVDLYLKRGMIRNIISFTFSKIKSKMLRRS